jgi:hypothetical protein
MKLNITFAGYSQDVAEVEQSMNDEDIKRIADEIVRSADTWRGMCIMDDPFRDYVVDRFVQTNMVYLRPKVPFG